MPLARTTIPTTVLLLALLPAALCGPALAGDLSVRQSRGLYGIFDAASGNFVVEPKYERISAVEGDVYKAVLRGNTGIINASGDVLIEFRYRELYRVGKHYVAQLEFHSETYGAPQRSGNVVVTTRYRRTEYKHGLLDGDGNVVIPLEHDVLRPLAYPVLFEAGVRTDFEPVNETTRHARFRFGVIDINNTVIVPIEYDEVKLIKEKTDARKVVVTYSKAGSPPQTLEYEVGKASAAGGSPGGKARKVVKFGSAGRFGFRTTGGETVIEPVFEDAWDFKNGYARVKKDGKWGFVAESGTVVVEPKYDYVWDFADGKAKVRLADGSTMLIDPGGKRLEGQ